MESLTSDHRENWTPDRQVSALKHTAYAIGIFILGVALVQVMSWTELPIWGGLSLFMISTAAFVVAPIMYLRSGMLIDFSIFKLPYLTDEYCRQVMSQANHLTAWVLLMALTLGWLSLPHLTQWLGFEQVDPDAVTGGFLLLGLCTWSISVLVMLRDG